MRMLNVPWLQAKPDMVINKEMKAAGLYKPYMHGHIPGTLPGDVYYGKGELAITGIHRSISNGIDYMCAALFHPVWDICLLYIIPQIAYQKDALLMRKVAKHGIMHLMPSMPLSMQAAICVHIHSGATSLSWFCVASANLLICRSLHQSRAHSSVC